MPETADRFPSESGTMRRTCMETAGRPTLIIDNTRPAINNTPPAGVVTTSRAQPRRRAPLSFQGAMAQVESEVYGTVSAPHKPVQLKSVQSASAHSDAIEIRSGGSDAVAPLRPGRRAV